MAGYSLYYSSLAFLAVAMLALAADLLWHHDAFNYRIIMPLNTAFLLTAATVVVMTATKRCTFIILSALLLILLVVALQLSGITLSTILLQSAQSGAIASIPPLQQLYWGFFIIAWLCYLWSEHNVSRFIFAASHLALLAISVLVIIADTRLPVVLALNNTISTSINTAIFLFLLAVAGLSSRYAGKFQFKRVWPNPVSWLAAALVLASVLLWLSFMHQLSAAKQQAFSDTADKFEQQLSQLLAEQYGLLRRMAVRLQTYDKTTADQQLNIEMQSYLDDFDYIDYLAVTDQAGRLYYSKAAHNDIKQWFDQHLPMQLAQWPALNTPHKLPHISLHHDDAAEHTYIRAVLTQPNAAGLTEVVGSINFNTLLKRILPVIVPPGYQVSLDYVSGNTSLPTIPNLERRFVLEGTKTITLLQQLSWQLVLYRDLATEVSYARQISEVVLLAGWLATLLALLGQQYQTRIQRQHMRLTAGNMRLQHSLEIQKKLQLQHQQIMDNSADMICVIDAQGRFVDVNQSCERILGYSATELLGRPFLDFTHPDDINVTEQEANQIVDGGKTTKNFRNRYLRKDGTVVHLMWVSNYLPSLGLMYAVARDINEMVNAERYQQDQQAILRQISTEQPLPGIFAAICQMAERQSGTVKAAIMIKMADTLTLAAAPSFSDQYWIAVASLPVADNVGSCGTAAFQKSLVIVEDIGNDEKWRQAAPIALAEGMQACWSLPMVSKHDEVLGTFALYCAEKRSPSKEELELMIACCRFAAVALERSQQRQLLQQSEQRFRSLFEFNPDPVYIISPEGYFIDMNDAGCQLLQYSWDEVISMHFDRVMLPEHLNRTLLHFSQVLAGNAQRFEASVISRTGRQIELDISILPNRENGKVIGVIGVAKDISKRRAAERQLRLFKRAVDATSNGVVIADILQPDMPIIYVNSAFEKLTGYSAAEVQGRNCRFLQGQQRDWLTVKQLRDAIALRQECSVVLKNYRKDNSLFWNNLFLAPVPDDQGEISHYIGIQTDITAQKQYEQELAHNASHDLLTGLPNRSLLGDRLNQSFSISRRHAQKVAVLFIDLDGFKLINDSLGHLSGDEVLKLVTSRIKEQIRPGDTLARLGGDEFVLLVPDVQDDAQLPQLARRILTTIAEPIKLQGQQVQLTASIGISVSGIELTEPMQLVQQADLAMYRAKQLGRNNYQWYDAEMDQSLSKQLSLKAMLRKAIEQQELELYYQPQVDAVTNELVGLEALLRWPHPEQGFISPDEFIPVAEDTGMIVEIGQWVLEQACTFNYQLQQQQLAFVPVAVNLSSMQFQRSEFIEQLQQTLLAQQLAPRYLQLELTESLLLENIEYVIEKLHQLKQLGISIAIDDFGTGYSSLNYLKRLPIDKLKIDRSFVRDIVSDQRDAAICRAIIAMAHQLNIKVVAEGVEHDAQVALLRKSVCDEFQGYHFAKPMSAQDTEQFLRHYTVKQQQRQDGSKQTLLLVDDEDNILHALKRLLRKEPYQVLTCTSAKQAFELLALHDIQVILSDQRMPQMNGTEFLSQVKTMYPDTVRLVLSGYTDLRSVTDAINRGAIYKFLTKPWQDDSLREEIRAAFKRYAEQMQKTQP
jgi:diguanylate cyclase (GGDEF)-like protein/PAS domain S-box-containing protein